MPALRIMGDMGEETKMNVWIIYQKDGYGGQEAGQVFSDEDAATRFVMDRDSYVLKSCMSHLMMISIPSMMNKG